MKQADHVWDYSPLNCAFPEQTGVSAVHVPIGYSSALERLPHDVAKDIDVLFYGSINARRSRILRALSERHRVETLPYLSLVDRCRYFLERDDERDQLAEDNWRTCSRESMIANVERGLMASGILDHG